MKKFNFRLEKIRKYREMLKDQSERELSIRSQELHKAEHIYDSLMQEKLRKKISYDNVLTAAELSLLGEYEGFLQGLLTKQVGVIEDAEIAVENAREDLVEKAKDEKALSLLKDRQEDLHKEEVRKEQRKQISEVALRGYRQGESKQEEE